MRVAITGHRPNRLKHRYHDYIKALLDGLETLDATYVYEGQAAGIDLLAVTACINRPVPYMAVVPYKGHRDFNKDPFWQEQWDAGMKHAESVYVMNTSMTYPGPVMFQKRNEYMVDNADVVLSVWDGSPMGGTKNCIEYAVSQSKTVYNIDPNTFDRRILHEAPRPSFTPSDASWSPPIWIAAAGATLF